MRQASHSLRNRRFYDDPNREHIIGASGEIAFSEWSGLPVDTKIYGGYGDGGFDFISESGLKIDVKTTTASARSILMVKVADAKKADVFVLAKYRDPPESTSLIGWAWASKLNRLSPKDSGRGIWSYWLYEESLSPMDFLKPHLNGMTKEK